MQLVSSAGTAQRKFPRAVMIPTVCAGVRRSMATSSRRATSQSANVRLAKRTAIAEHTIAARCSLSAAQGNTGFGCGNNKFLSGGKVCPNTDFVGCGEGHCCSGQSCVTALAGTLQLHSLRQEGGKLQGRHMPGQQWRTGGLHGVQRWVLSGHNEQPVHRFCGITSASCPYEQPLFAAFSVNNCAVLGACNTCDTCNPGFTRMADGSCESESCRPQLGHPLTHLSREWRGL